MHEEKVINRKSQAQFDVREVGYVESIRQFVVIAKGLPFCMNGQIVEFANKVLGLVIGFTEHEIQILVLGSAADIRAGDEIYNKGKRF